MNEYLYVYVSVGSGRDASSVHKSSVNHNRGVVFNQCNTVTTLTVFDCCQRYNNNNKNDNNKMETFTKIFIINVSNIVQ